MDVSVRCSTCGFVDRVPRALVERAACTGAEYQCRLCSDPSRSVPESVAVVASATRRAPESRDAQVASLAFRGMPWERG